MSYHDEKLYLSTVTKGVQILNRSYEKVEGFELAEIGLQNQVNSIIVKDSLIWFANSTGIGFINRITKKITFLESNDAFQTRNFAYSSKYDFGDSIYFGGENGVVIVNTKKIGELKKDFKTYIAFPTVYRGDGQFNLSKGKEENLNHYENNLEYQIVHTNYTYPSSVRFRYRLKEDMPWKLVDKSGLLRLYNLLPGNYKIEVKNISTDKIVDTRKFTIHPPWYQTWWFRISLGLLILSNIIYITRLYYRRRIIAQQKEIEKQNALQEERDRISHDMHDDLGSGLSTIKMIGEMLQSKYPDEQEAQEEINEIIQQTDKLNLSMREMVWSLNPKEDTLTNFIFYVQVYLRKFYAPSTLQLSLHFPDEIPSVSMKGVLRRNVLLCIKEINNNIIKHAKATEVSASITINKDLSILIMTVEDNGIGLPKDLKENNGFTTMRNRIESSGGSIEWQRLDKGTRVKFSVPIV